MGKNFGGSDFDCFNSIVETSSGELIVVGSSFSTNAGFTSKGDSDAIIVKYDKDGNQLWVKNFGGSDFDCFNSIVETSSGELIVVGSSSSTGADFSSKGYGDGIIIKYDKDGNQQWINSFSGTDDEGFESVIKTYDKGFIAVGYSYSTDVGFINNSELKAIMVKYNKDGNQEWIKSFGGSNENWFNSVLETKNGAIVAVGWSSSLDAGYKNKGYYDAIIVKYNDECKKNENLFIDIKELDINKNYQDCFKSIIQTSDEGTISVGYSDSNNIGFKKSTNQVYDYDAIIVKHNKNGNQEWIKNFGGSNGDYFYSAIEASDKGIVAIGYSYSTDAGFINKGVCDTIIVKYDKDGNQQWAKNFGGSSIDYFKSIVETSGGDLIAVGYSNSTDSGFTNNGGTDAIIVKYDKDGNQQWVKNFGGSSSDYFNSIVETSGGDLIAVGHSNSTNSGFTNNGLYDAIIVKYDKDGNQLWVKNFGGSRYDYFNSVIETQDGGLIAVGYSDSTNAGFTNNGGNDAIIVKYDKDGNQQWVKNFGGSAHDYFNSIVATLGGEFIVSGSSSSEDAGFINMGYEDAIIVKYDVNGNQEWTKNIKIKNMENASKLENVRTQLNALPEGELKEYLNEKVNSIYLGFGELERKTSSSMLDIYIKSENMLSMSINTNSVTFEEFSGVEDVEKTNAVNITINSSLPYELNAYLVSNITNSDKSNTMDLDILNIKENSEVDYQSFTSTGSKILLKDNNTKGNDINHGIDLMLKGNIAHKADIYKTTIKFEAVQK